jgi:hypothetical protein
MEQILQKKRLKMNGWYFSRIMFLMDGMQFNTIWLNTPWGKISLEAVLLGVLLFFLLIGQVQRILQNLEFRKFQKKLEQNANFELKFRAAQRKIREQQRETQTLKKLLIRKNGKESRSSVTDCGEEEDNPEIPEEADTENKIPLMEKIRTGGADKKPLEKSGQKEEKESRPGEAQKRPLADQIMLIAKELSPEKLKPDKDAQIFRVMETLFSRNNNQAQKKKGATAMSEKQDKSVVKEIGIFRLFIIGTLLSILTNMLAETWKRVKYRFEEKNPPEEEKS